MGAALDMTMSQGLLESTGLDWFLRSLGPESAYRSIVMALATLVVLVVAHKVTRRKLEAYLAAQAHKPENAQAFLRTYSAVWKALIGIAVVVAASGSFALMGLTIAFLGTLLGWSLQAPIRGLAAWAMVILKRPFCVGDRITVADVTGDVVDIQLNHILLNQVGGTVQGEERSGRGIFVPNAMLFGQEIINYNYFAKATAEAATPMSKFMLDEVVVRVTLGSDFALAKRLCIGAAEQAVAELIGETDEAPFTRVEFLAWGILLRVRYRTIPARRQEVSSRVTELVWQAFRANRRHVDFAIPANVVGVQPVPGAPLPPMAPGGASRP